MTAKSYLTLAILAATCLASASGQLQIQQQQQQQQQQINELQQQGPYPHYIQSPIQPFELVGSSQQQNVTVISADQLQQAIDEPTKASVYETRATAPSKARAGKLRPGQSGYRPWAGGGGGRAMNISGAPMNRIPVATSLDPSGKAVVQKSSTCLYEKKYFSRLDECLARRPYPTIGLPALRNEDLIVKRGLKDKQGCSFLLNNGLFKNQQIGRLSIDSDSQCLDGSRVGLSLGMNNVSLVYLWSLRCLNRADQLLDDATVNGKVGAASHSGSGSGDDSEQVSGSSGAPDSHEGICVGSSQSFGFATLQLSAVEAQVELATDIFKNWRITNITLAMGGQQQLSGLLAPPLSNPDDSASRFDIGDPALAPPGSTNIREFIFESLDGDELNWRYLHLFQNWSRNKMHANFLDQYRRFLWISLQHCLSEASDKLPTKLKDIFSGHRYV